MKLRSKLLMTFLLSMLVLVIVLLLMLRWSFERGATTFVRKMDQEELSALAGQLADYYADAGSWQAFSRQPQQWNRWLLQHGFGGGFPAPLFAREQPEPADVARLHEPDMSPERTPQMPPRGKPFFLLDGQQRLVVGRSHRKAALVPIAVTVNDASEIVGYLGLSPPPSRMMDFWQHPMVEKQRQLLLYFTLGALLVSVVVAVPLSGRWVRRILQLHHYVSTLRGGVYNQSLVVGGNDEIADLARHLNALAESLAQAQHQRQQMTADISHELRTPVANLQANIEAMQDGVVPLSPAAIAQLHEQTRRLSALINDLYQLSLADAGALAYEKSPFDLAELLGPLVSSYQLQFEQKGLSLELLLNGDKPLRVVGDFNRLQQVFINLIENSLRYTDSPGKVRITGRSDNQLVKVTLSDSAPGVDPSLYPRLTDRLFRVDASRSRVRGGAGLGLNLCAAIIQAHDGELSFGDSELGGLAVTVTLPAIEK